jgi:glutamate formiminotransferase
MNKLISCVPNFSEGRNTEIIDKIVESFRNKDKVKLLDYDFDYDHNRLIVTAMGETSELKIAVIEAIGRAVELIDMTTHRGTTAGCVAIGA